MDLFSVYFFDASLGWVVGNNGIILSTTNGGVSSVEDENAQPIKFILEQNFPNPFNPSTIIEFRIADFGFVNLKVYDVLGNEVATLVDGYKSAGRYEVEFNVSSLSGSVSAKGGYASGVYFYQLKAGNFIAAKKMILLK